MSTTNNHTDNNNEDNNNESFWNTLQSGIISAEHSSYFYDDLFAYVEQNAMFSLFFRGFSQLELIHFKEFFLLKDYGYLILVELLPRDDTNQSDENSLDYYRFIKNILSDKSHFTVGHLISNRISILVTEDHKSDFDIVKEDSLSISRKLSNKLRMEFDVDSIIGIGNLYSLNSIFASFVECLSSLTHCQVNHIVHINDINKKEVDVQIDYDDAMRHMKDAIVHRKTASYDYFSILMEKIKPLNDNNRRNKILEILVVASLSVQATGDKDGKNRDYIGFSKEMSQLSEDMLIEWAFKNFIAITGYVKPKKTIDYSNDLVKITQEFLEAHYAEDITLDDVAAQVNISSQYFSKLIKKTTGFNFTEWLSMLRVKKAKELLTDTNLTVKEVCYKVGYKDPNYFSRIFKKKMGITPSEYIKTRSHNLPKS